MSNTGNFTFFSNDTGSASSSQAYIQDAFQDITLPATNNTGLSSTINTNPLGNFYGNDNAVTYGAKTLYFKDLYLLNDHSKWINSKPTYQIVFTENFPAINCYAFGDLSYSFKSGQKSDVSQGQLVIKLNGIGSSGDGISVNGVVRRVAFLMQPDTQASAGSNQQIVVDGSNGGTFAPNNGIAASTAVGVQKFEAFTHAASNETNDIHDIRFFASGTTSNVIGIIVYFENSGNNINIRPGTTFVDKQKITTLTGATLSVPTYGSSMGGVALVYENSSSGYSIAISGVSNFVGTGQGSSGTNILNLDAGGSFFAAGYAVAAQTAGNYFVGMVSSVSTNALTMGQTLTSTASGAIYNVFKTGNTLMIGSSAYTLSKTINFSDYISFSNSIIDSQNSYNVWGANLGITTSVNVDPSNLDYYRSALFLGGSGFLQVDGHFSAAEVEFTYGVSATIHATFSVNGLPAYSLFEQSLKRIDKRTVFTDAGPGWNSFVVGCGVSMGQVGIAKINLYEKLPSQGISGGILASLNTNQAYTDRGVANASLMALGLGRRTYADQLYLQGNWARAQGSTAPGGAFYFGTSTNSVMTHTYYGKDWAIIGTAGGGTLTFDGAGVGLSFGIMRSVATEGFHTIQYTSGSGATSQIAAIDYVRTYGGINDLRKFAPVGSTTIVSKLPTPFTVKTPATTSLNVCAAYVQLGTGTPVLASSSGAWISSLTDGGGGITTYTLINGIFTSAPYVVGSVAEDSNGVVRVHSINQNSFILETANDAGTNSDRDVNVIAIGAR